MSGSGLPECLCSEPAGQRAGGQLPDRAPGDPIPSPAVFDQTAFRNAVRRFADDERIRWCGFTKTDRKIEKMRSYLAAQTQTGRPGVAAIGFAQEDANVFTRHPTRTQRDAPQRQPVVLLRQPPVFTVILGGVCRNGESTPELENAAAETAETPKASTRSTTRPDRVPGSLRVSIESPSATGVLKASMSTQPQWFDGGEDGWAALTVDRYRRSMRTRPPSPRAALAPAICAPSLIVQRMPPSVSPMIGEWKGPSRLWRAGPWSAE